MNEIESAVLKIVATIAGVRIGAVPKTATIQDVGISSLDAIEMLFQLEERFDLLLSDRDVDLQTATTADLILAVEHAVARKSGTVHALRIA